MAGEYRDVAFAPLYPAIIRVLSAPWPAFAGLISVVFSNVVFLAALGLLARLGTPYLGRRRAALAAGLLAIYPFASAFGMAYTESLFLLFIVAAFLAAERRHRAWAGVFLALAVLSRLQGVGLIVPLWILMLRQDGWRPRASLGWLLLGPLAALGFVLYVGTVTGSPTGFLDAQQAWGRSGIGGAAPDETIAAKFSPYQAALVLTLLWSAFLLVFRRTDRMRFEYWLVPVVFIAAELSSGSLEAVGRITMLAFPYAWILANRRSLFMRRAWPVISAGLFTTVAILQFGGLLGAVTPDRRPARLQRGGADRAGPRRAVRPALRGERRIGPRWLPHADRGARGRRRQHRRHGRPRPRPAPRPATAAGGRHAARCCRCPTAARAPRCGPGCSPRPSDLVVFADADMATPPDQLPAAGRGAAPTTTSPSGRGSSPTAATCGRRSPRFRRLLGQAFHLLASIWVVGQVQDTQCGFKGFTREAAHDLFAPPADHQHRLRRGAHLPRPPPRLPDRRRPDPLVRTSAARGCTARPRPGVRVAWDLFRIPLLHRCWVGSCVDRRA